ncbi:MAG: site-specific integrase [Prevotella sp.]|nr:site-specific integrase [Prevotella sp.]
MKTVPIEININIQHVEDLRIKLNGKEYALVPIEDSKEEQQVQSNAPTLTAFVEQLIQDLRREGRVRTSETYHGALTSFKKFLQGKDIAISAIDSTLIAKYEQHLKGQGLISNSTSFYMRVLRTIYNKAVANHYTTDKQPFAKVYTGIGKTAKRAISLEAIQRISHLTGLTKKEEWARDLFLLSFYTRGMAFIDLANLSPQNIKNGILTYRRHKTGQEIIMRWEPQMQAIVNRHPSPNKQYLLPIIKRINGRERCQYREGLRVVNAMLKPVGRKVGLTEPLTMYVARHSWASIARSMNIPLNIISQGMGHTSEQTTQIYLKSLRNKGLDAANANIIKAVSNLTTNELINK